MAPAPHIHADLQRHARDGPRAAGAAARRRGAAAVLRTGLLLRWRSARLRRRLQGRSPCACAASPLAAPPGRPVGRGTAVLLALCLPPLCPGGWLWRAWSQPCWANMPTAGLGTIRSIRRWSAGLVCCASRARWRNGCRHSRRCHCRRASCSTPCCAACRHRRWTPFLRPPTGRCAAWAEGAPRRKSAARRCSATRWQGLEWIAAAYALGGGYLLWRRVIRWQVPLGVIGASLLVSLPFWLSDPDTHPSPLHLVCGGLMLTAFFVATDPVTGATTPRGHPAVRRRGGRAHHWPSAAGAFSRRRRLRCAADEPGRAAARPRWVRRAPWPPARRGPRHELATRARTRRSDAGPRPWQQASSPAPLLTRSRLTAQAHASELAALTAVLPPQPTTTTPSPTPSACATPPPYGRPRAMPVLRARRATSPVRWCSKRSPPTATAPSGWSSASPPTAACSAMRVLEHRESPGFTAMPSTRRARRLDRHLPRPVARTADALGAAPRRRRLRPARRRHPPRRAR